MLSTSKRTSDILLATNICFVVLLFHKNCICQKLILSVDDVNYISGLLDELRNGLLTLAKRFVTIGANRMKFIGP